MPESRLIIPDTSPPELKLYGVVGAAIFENSFEDTEVLDALAEVGRGTDIIVRLNSPGGLVPTGKAIFNALVAHRGKVTVSVDAMAASSGSLIAMGGDEILMRQGSVMMVHNPALFTVGTIEDHEKAIAYLKAETEGAVDIYAQKTGQDPDTVRAQMSAETWMTADQALEFGYCDRVENGSKAEMFAAFPYAQLYEHAPKSVLRLAAKQGWNRWNVRKDRPLMAQNPNNQNPGNPPQPGPANPQNNPNPNPPAAAMSAADIVDACTAGGVANLASALIREAATSERVHARIATAKQVKVEVAQARKIFSGIPEMLGDELIAGGGDLAHCQAQIWQRVANASAAAPTNTQFTQAGLPGSATGSGERHADASGRPSAEQDAAWDKVLARANARFQRGPAKGFYAGSVPAGITGPGAPQK